ncbi:MAG TPA: PQQ-binding-like beta-propeller repeat protein, partial [Pyrinomonadaceae bacterium]
MRKTKHGRLFVSAAATLLAFALAACAAGAADQPASLVGGAPAATPAATAQPAAPADAAAPPPAPADGTNAPVVAPAVAAGANAGVSEAAAAEWPQWRGPNRDGLAPGAAAPSVWPKELKPRWRVTVGIGHASPVVSGGTIYQHARQGEEEVLLALDAATGRELWRAGAVAAPYEVNPAASGHGKGPKSTPVVAGGRVYTLGIAGLLSAHDAKTGRL